MKILVSADMGGVYRHHLDGLVVTVGAPAFGLALDLEAAVSKELFAVNVLGPMTLVRSAAPELTDGGFVAVFAAILPTSPPPGWPTTPRRRARSRPGWACCVVRNAGGSTALDVRPPRSLTCVLPPMRREALVD